MHKRNKRGFTIVELLIVIVVIGILAAISLNVFNGMQQRANNSRVLTGVKAYYSALLQYKTVNGSYPASTAGCIGSGYVDTTQCWTDELAGGIMEAGFASAAFDTAMAPFIGGSSQVSVAKNMPYMAPIICVRACTIPVVQVQGRLNITSSGRFKTAPSEGLRG